MMKVSARNFASSLTAAGIEECSAGIRDFLSQCQLPKREVTRCVMAVEEILLRHQEVAGEETSFQVTMGIRFFRSCITLSVNGEAYNAGARDEEVSSVLGESLLAHLGQSAEYAYAGNKNNYTFRLQKKQVSPFIPLIIALTAAFLVSSLGYLLPNETRVWVLDNVLAPLHDTFLNILGCIAGPMVFLSVAWGIYGIGDAMSFKRIGKRMLLGYVGIVFLTASVITTAALPFFSLTHSGVANGGSAEVDAVFSMILNIFPKNIFSPFVDGNTLQIIFLAIVIGVAMLFLGRKTNAVAKAVEQINYIVQFLIEFISRLVPYFIFIVIVDIMWSDTGEILLRTGKVFAVFIGMVLALAVGTVCVSSIRNRVSPLTLLRKGLPTLLVALTTASSAAAFGVNIKVCRDKYGIDDKIASFGLPLGMVTFKPTTALNFTAAALFFAEMYRVEVSLSWFVMLLFTAGILAVATPPIPGGALTAYTVLFSQLGIPTEALAVALACDALFDFVDTGFDQFLLPFALLGQARKLGLADRDTVARR